MKTTTKLFLKEIGSQSYSVVQILYAVFLIGAVQLIYGLWGLFFSRETFFEIKNIKIAFLFGVSFTISVSLSFFVFMDGGDVGINTLIVSLSLFVGALLDSLFFGKYLAFRGWIGICMAVIAGYVVIGSPSVSSVLTLPRWIHISFVIMLLTAIQQAFLKGARHLNSYVFNFWSGVVCVAITAASLVCLNKKTLLSGEFMVLSCINAVLFLVLFNCAIFGFASGAHIALKNVLLNCVYISSTVFLAFLIFGEAVEFSKFFGILMFIAAVFLIKYKKEEVSDGTVRTQ